MKNHGISIQIFLLTLLYHIAFSQEKLEVGGAIIIQNSEDVSPVPGTIRWTGDDFEGWNGNDWISLTGGAIKDINNNAYKVVTIGTQTWMAENLRVAHYNDGTPIPLVTDNTAWEDAYFNSNPAYTWYDNGNYDTPEYGALYSWYAIDILSNGNKNVCPTGWHVPNEADWTNLTNHLGGTSVAGGKMKETGLGHWDSPNIGATNESGFLALPGGTRSLLGAFTSIGSYGIWWSSSQVDVGLAWYRELSTSDDNANEEIAPKGFGFSVRCLRDD